MSNSGRKKWCDFCHTNVPFNDFRHHENTQIHKRNKQRELDYQQAKSRREKVRFEELSIEERERQKMLAQIETDALAQHAKYSNPEDAKGSNLESFLGNKKGTTRHYNKDEEDLDLPP